MKFKNYIVLFLFALFFTILLFDACKKDPAPINPYSTVNYGTTTTLDTLDKNSLIAIHRDIFFPKCAKPGCHDGHFDPDFRTVESAYSTLVYQPIHKNNIAKSFYYRVVPDSSSRSVLYERLNNCCFVNTNDRMPQDNIGTPLPDDDLLRVKTWIDNGAKDIFNQVSLPRDTLPVFPWWSAFDSKYFPANWISISDDTNRINNNGSLSVIMDTNKSFILIPWITEYKIPIGNLIHSRLLLSYKMDDFSAPIRTVYPTAETFGDKTFWVCSMNTAGLLTDTIIYMRYYCNDGLHSQDAEFPTNTLWSGYKTYWSLYIKP